jgi:hypothetical protein
MESPNQRGHEPRTLTNQSCECEWKRIGREAAAELRRLTREKIRTLTLKDRQ